MIPHVKTFLILSTLLMLVIIPGSIEAATFNVRLVQNDAPSPTLFSCRVSVEEGKISISGSGYNKPLRAMVRERDHAKAESFKDHSVVIEEDKIAADFLMIAKHFELCHEGSDMKLVSGGTITKIECVPDKGATSKKAYYIALDQSKRRPNFMEDICRDIQTLVVSDFLKNAPLKKHTLESLRTRSAKLASSISTYTEALSLLEHARKSASPADWKKISALVQFRPNQPPVEKRSRLVRAAHDVLTASCSERGLRQILGKSFSDERALILKIGKARRCRGSFSYPENPDWGFDDVGTSLGLVYPPQKTGMSVGIMDWGLERLILHFALNGAPDAASSYDRFSLTLSGRDWDVFERWNFKKDPIPKEAQGRLKYLSSKSGLMEHLLEGEVPEDVTFLDVQAIVIEDDNWKAARLDYRLGNEAHVLPFFITDGDWVPNRPWTDRSYRDVGDYIENRDYFRPRADVEKHNAEQYSADQPATAPESKPEGKQKPQPESEGRP